MASIISPLLEIPTVTALQLVSSLRIPLASGTLTLTHPPSTSALNESLTNNTTTDTITINEPILLLTIDKITIPLPPTTVAVSTTDHSQYLLATPLSSSDTGFIHLSLPSLPTLSPLGIKLTSLLLSHGFLKNSQVEDEDDLVSALQIALGGGVNEKQEEVKFSETTKSIASGAVEGSAKIAELSGMVASAVSNATFEAGRWVGEKIGVATGGIDAGSGEKGEKWPVRKVVDEGMETTANTAGKVGNSVANTSAAIGDSVSKSAEDRYGGEAKELVEQSRETVGNVGKVAVNAVLGTSVVWQAGEAAVGAVKAGQVKDKESEKGDVKDGMEDVKI
ncbi:uncharacterized protein H6S33_005554 [Morchella sextelata]|uniref:uncharacterized protein n=1 Tax=Morchella sextelata TaxID=1174677 RepID=UPI001D054C44|nr:uncharacterized protein H6S33_005554 [Morchella sextelata]KAH0613668.1 hypothetical protein H6S33_005554 [Morchella sextelata]